MEVQSLENTMWNKGIAVAGEHHGNSLKEQDNSISTLQKNQLSYSHKHAFIAEKILPS